MIARICKLLRGIIDDKQRCLAWAGITWGAISVALTGVLVTWGFMNHEAIPVIAPLITNLALAQLALIAVVVLNLRNRKFSASFNGNSVSLGGDDLPDDVEGLV